MDVWGLLAGPQLLIQRVESLVPVLTVWVVACRESECRGQLDLDPRGRRIVSQAGSVAQGDLGEGSSRTVRRLIVICISRSVLEDLKLGSGLVWCVSSVRRIRTETRVSWRVPQCQARGSSLKTYRLFMQSSPKPTVCGPTLVSDLWFGNWDLETLAPWRPSSSAWQSGVKASVLLKHLFWGMGSPLHRGLRPLPCHGCFHTMWRSIIGNSLSVLQILLWGETDSPFKLRTFSNVLAVGSVKKRCSFAVKLECGFLQMRWYFKMAS